MSFDLVSYLMVVFSNPSRAAAISSVVALVDTLAAEVNVSITSVRAVSQSSLPSILTQSRADGFLCTLHFLSCSTSLALEDTGTNRKWHFPIACFDLAF